MKPLDWQEIKGNWATVMTPVNADNTIDYDRLKAEVEVILSFGVDGLYTNGTAGEFHNQTEDEFDRINGLVADLCNAAGMPFQIGVSHMSPIIPRERLRRVLSLKPSAVQIILPDWVVPNPSERVTFLEGMASVAGNIGLIVYNPPHAKCCLSPREFGELKKKVPSFVGVKVAGGDDAWYEAVRREMTGLSVFVTGHELACGIPRGAHGAYSNVAALHPRAAQEWYELMTTDIDRAVDIGNRIKGFFAEQIIPYSRKGYCNTALDKFLAAMGNWAGIGTRLRWPYQYLPEDEATRLRGPFCRAVPEFAPFLE